MSAGVKKRTNIRYGLDESGSRQMVYYILKKRRNWSILMYIYHGQLRQWRPGALRWKWGKQGKLKRVSCIVHIFHVVHSVHLYWRSGKILCVADTCHFETRQFYSQKPRPRPMIETRIQTRSKRPRHGHIWGLSWNIDFDLTIIMIRRTMTLILIMTMTLNMTMTMNVTNTTKVNVIMTIS